MDELPPLPPLPSTSACGWNQGGPSFCEAEGASTAPLPLPEGSGITFGVIKPSWGQGSVGGRGGLMGRGGRMGGVTVARRAAAGAFGVSDSDED